jgi:hypothetical protein
MVNAPQLGGDGLLQTNIMGSPPFNAVYRNGSVYTSTAYQGAGGAPSLLRMTEFNVSAWPTMTASSSTFSALTIFYHFPAVTANLYGDVMMNFSCSGVFNYAGSRATRRFAGDASFSPSIVVKEGVDYYGNPGDTSADVFRWGDYGGVAVDPVDQGFWCFQKFGDTRVGAPIWCTWFGYFPRAVFVDGANGGTEAGTRSQPYNTVMEGHNGCLNGNDLVIRTGSYPSTAILTRAVTIIADGGPVVIGQ